MDVDDNTDRENAIKFPSAVEPFKLDKYNCVFIKRKQLNFNFKSKFLILINLSSIDDILTFEDELLYTLNEFSFTSTYQKNPNEIENSKYMEKYRINAAEIQIQNNRNSFQMQHLKSLINYTNKTQKLNIMSEKIEYNNTNRLLLQTPCSFMKNSSDNYNISISGMKGKFSISIIKHIEYIPLSKYKEILDE